jgi:hypothetical protein
LAAWEKVKAGGERRRKTRRRGRDEWNKARTRLQTAAQDWADAFETEYDVESFLADRREEVSGHTALITARTAGQSIEKAIADYENDGIHIVFMLKLLDLRPQILMR